MSTPGRRDLLTLAMGLAVALVACTRSDAAVDPVWGKQPCAHCAMVLSDRRFGAQILTGAGDRLYFDDVGCMVLYADANHLGEARAWVHDAQTGQWLDAKTARYADTASSPMDFGFEGRAAEGVAWDAMRARVIGARRAEP